jgi:hypothetical protein
MDAPPSAPKVESVDVAILIAGIAFAAFCVWLGVRVYNRRERWAKKTAICAVVMVLYVAGLGPACWISSRSGRGGAALSFFYRPLTWLTLRGGRAEFLMDSYCHAAAAREWGWLRYDPYPQWAEIPRHPYAAEAF